MRQTSFYAFTLVELIVVITILAILGTIGFLSMNGYSQNARNSTRISDLKLIDKGLSLYIQTQSLYPLPDTPTGIYYSGALAWTQGVFGSGMQSELARISTVPKDPLAGVEYSYSTTQNRKSYQLAAAVEAGLFGYRSALSDTSYAFENSDLSSRVLGNFVLYDVSVPSASGCVLLAVPSILLSDIPPGGVIADGGVYNFLLNKGKHLPLNYFSTLQNNTPGTGFQVNQVLDECAIADMNALDLYIARLSTSYFPLAAQERYQNLIFNSNSQDFQKESLLHLQEHGVTIDPSVLRAVNIPIVQEVFDDTFSNADATLLIGGHTPNGGFGFWSMIAGGNSSSYEINNQRLEKTTGASTLIFPSTNPLIQSPDYSVSLDIEDFAAGTIEIYLRYTNANNYYKLTLQTSGYQIERKIAGVNTLLQNINDPIALGSSITFAIHSDSLVLSINAIEKENFLAGGISNVGSPVVSLQNAGSNIDNFHFIYQ